MKQKAHTSRSTYRAILHVQKRRDEPSGLYVSDRFFQPEGGQKPRRSLWLLTDVLLLGCLMTGLLLLLTSGFAVSVSWWFYPGVWLLCAGIVVLFRSSWCSRHRLVTGAILLLLYLVLLLLCQDTFLRGLGQFGNLMVATMNRTYAGELEALSAVTGSDAAERFLLLAAVPAMLWLGASLLWSSSMLMACLLLFPLLVLVALCGAAGNTAALFLVLFGVVLCMAFSRPKRQHRMWGGENQQLQAQNRLRFEAVQKKAAAIMLLVSVALSVPGFFLVRPFLSVSLEPAAQLSVDIQSRFLSKALEVLPELTAGAVRLNVETVSGGVQDGAVDGDAGYLLEGVEDLRLTLDQKPKETIFLKGYIGTVYENGSWENSYGSTFDGAAINWNTDGDPRLYIQNLPFLRTAFALAQRDSADQETASAVSEFALEPAQLQVERINANERYTYVPYGAYLNGYYQVEGGDGPVAGQSEQEDKYYFFFREDMEAVLSAWNDLESTDNVLDRVEESYRAFCATNAQTACEGLDALQAQVEAVAGENGWSAEENADEITAWIRQYLAENYRYAQDPDPAPEGEDPLAYFLFASKEGGSVQFASAAVALYRMFGVPARYVVGYEVPAPLFTHQADGTYTATVQGDNAQAWAEIYVPGQGWTPKDMTPGVIGTYEEVGPGGERIETAAENGPEEANVQPEGESAESAAAPAASPAENKRWTDLTLEQIVMVFLYLTLAALLAAGILLGGRRTCRIFGLDPFHRRSRLQRLTGVFRALYVRMGRLGLPGEISSQSEAFAAFCEAELAKRSPETEKLVRPAVERLYRCFYGAGEVSEGDIRTMRRILLASYNRARR